jgi:hypothetical protein
LKIKFLPNLVLGNKRSSCLTSLPKQAAKSDLFIYIKMTVDADVEKIDVSFRNFDFDLTANR